MASVGVDKMLLYS